MTNNQIINSGALVSVTTNATGEQVFNGYLLGQNSKVIIGIELAFLTQPEAHISSNFESIKRLNQSDMEDNLDTWLAANPKYVTFNTSTHTVTVIEENTTDFKASAQNDVYDFKRNKWGEVRHGMHERPISVSDNPMNPCKNVIIECIGGENIYFIINGLQCAVKNPNIHGCSYPYAFGIGVYNLVQDPNDPDMLNAELVQSYDTEVRKSILAPEAKAA